MKISELVGRTLGWLLVPAAAAGSAIRRARLFHPAGVVYRAEVGALAHDDPLARVARRLEGEATVRLSSALWRGSKTLPDVLGFAIRFHGIGPHPLIEAPSPADQDLLFATIRRPATMLLALLTTNARSFLHNDYYAVSPFDAKGFGRVRWRVVAPRTETVASPGREVDRAEELRRAVDLDLVVFRLEAKRTQWGAPWQPVVEVRLLEPLNLDQEALRFSPFRTGRGIEPRGFVHSLREGVYWASQLARPAHR